MTQKDFIRKLSRFAKRMILSSSKQIGLNGVQMCYINNQDDEIVNEFVCCGDWF